MLVLMRKSLATLFSILAGQSSISSKLGYLAQKQASHQAASMVINRKVSGKKDAENFSNNRPAEEDCLFC